MNQKGERKVLVGVLKDKRDLEILLNEKWYRIPKTHAPKRKFKYVAFYQPLEFDKSGKCIKYYAKVDRIEYRKRIELLPNEPDHPRADDSYLKICFDKICELKKTIPNIIPRRIIFGFTTLEKLLTAHDILELYDIEPTEQVIETFLKKEGIAFKSQHYVIINNKKRYRLDFAIFCRNGQIAVECDNDDAHQTKQQKLKDRQKNEDLERLGWNVVRLREDQILFAPKVCIEKIKSEMHRRGG